jgi:hypothetical protein
MDKCDGYNMFWLLKLKWMKQASLYPYLIENSAVIYNNLHANYILKIMKWKYIN